MAETRVGVRGAYRIVNKSCGTALAKNRNKSVNVSIQSAPLSTGIRSNWIRNDLDATETLQRAPSQVAGVVTPDCCATQTPSSNTVSFQILYPNRGLDSRESRDVSSKNNGVDEELIDTQMVSRCYLSYNHRSSGTPVRVLVPCGRSTVRRRPSVTDRIFGVWGRKEQMWTYGAVKFAHRQQSIAIFIRAYGGGGVSDEPLYRSKTAYYDILEVSPNATHAQIKTAYYKQSFLYHPDKNAGSEDATARFAEISEAYTVLGNKGLKKKYDRGILSQSDLTGAPRPSGKDSSRPSTQQTPSRDSPATGPGSSNNMFDFDDFIKAHYREQFQRDKDIKARKAEIKQRAEGIKDAELGRVMEVFVGAMAALALVILVNLKL